MRSDTPIPPEAPVVDHEALLAANISDIADAIYGAEGLCQDLHGQSGEYGCFQFLPSTWRAYSMAVAGEVIAHTPANERRIAEGMIRKWLDEGVSERGIFLTWNQGNPGPDCYRGINKHGVRYDSCDYANRGLMLLSAARAERLARLSLVLVQQ